MTLNSLDIRPKSNLLKKFIEGSRHMNVLHGFDVDRVTIENVNFLQTYPFRDHDDNFKSIKRVK